MVWRESTSSTKKSLQVRHLERCLACEDDSVGTTFRHWFEVISACDFAMEVNARSGAYCYRPRKRDSAPPADRIAALIRLFTTRFNQGSILRSPSQNPWNKNLPPLKTTPLDENYGSGWPASLWRPA